MKKIYIDRPSGTECYFYGAEEVDQKIKELDAESNRLCDILEEHQICSLCGKTTCNNFFETECRCQHSNGD